MTAARFGEDDATTITFSDGNDDAAVLGGLDSPGGAVVGGVVIGITQNLTAGYQPDLAPWLGNNFHQVMPYVVMIAILVVRPYGLFGTPEVHRA